MHVSHCADILNFAYRAPQKILVPSSLFAVIAKGEFLTIVHISKLNYIFALTQFIDKHLHIIYMADGNSRRIFRLSVDIVDWKLGYNDKQKYKKIFSELSTIRKSSLYFKRTHIFSRLTEVFFKIKFLMRPLIFGNVTGYLLQGINPFSLLELWVQINSQLNIIEFNNVALHTNMTNKQHECQIISFKIILYLFHK